MEIIPIVINLLILIAFYLWPMFDLIKYKTNKLYCGTIAAVSLMVGYSTNFGYSITLLTFTSIFILHSVFTKSLPFNLKDNIYSKGVNFNRAFFSIAVVKLLTLIVGGYLITLLDKIGISSEVQQQAVTEATKSVESNDHFAIIIFFITTCILAPLTEEYTIRYWLHGYLFKHKYKMNSFISAIASSIIFASMHDSLNGIVLAFVGGLGLTWVYEKYGLKYSIFAHFVFNFVSFITITLVK